MVPVVVVVGFVVGGEMSYKRGESSETQGDKHQRSFVWCMQTPQISKRIPFLSC